MAKLCPHHQRQIVDALGFLQTEVKALARCSSLQAPCHTPDNQESTTSITTSSPVTYEKSVSEPSPSAVSTQSTQGMSLVIASSPTTTKEVPEESGLLKSSLTADPCLDLHTLGLGSAMALVNSTLNPSDPENNRHSDHVPLKMKIMKTNKLADGKKLSCVLTTSLITQSDTMEEKQGKSDSSNKTESQSARLSSTVKRHSHMNQDGQTKDIAAKPFPVHKTSNTLLADVPRTARKTIRGSSDHRTRNSASRVIIDPDLGNCDIVYINKPITECLREQQCHMPPRRNARKSTRGHMYVEEMWELKTVRTLAGRNQSSNCPNPMPELFTLVTPKQVLAKPDGVPPIDMPFIRGCGQTVQQTPSEESNDREMPGTGDEVEALANQFDLIVETSQTDQSKNNEQATCESTSKAPEENGEKAANEVQDATSNAIQTGESDQLDESVVETSPAVEETREIDQDLNEFTEQEVDLMERPEDDVMKEAELIPVTESGESEQQQKDTLPTVAITVQEEVNEKVENTKCEQTLEPQLVEPKLSDKLGTEENSLTAPAESIVKEQEMDIAPVTSVVNNAAPEDDDEYDVSAKSLESLLKELPPWRRKRGTVVSLPKRLREKQSVIVGYVNGRPVSASDRSLRRRSSNSIPTTPKKAAEKPTHSGPENVPSPQNIPETDGAITSENIPMIPQETEHVPEIPQTPETKRLPKSSTKLSKKKSAAIVQHNQQETQVEFIHVSDESIDIPQHTPSKRPLRSARQQLPGTTESPVCPNAIVSSSPTPTSDHSIPSMDAVQLLATSPSPPPSVLLPLSLESPVSPIAPEQSQQCTHEHAVELNVADGQSAKTRPKEIQKQEMESRLQTKQKLRSAKVAMVDDKNEKEKCCSTLESQIVQSNETPSSTLTSERSLGEVETCEMAVKTSNVCLLHDEPSLGSTISSVLGKPARMPLRSESSKAETSSQLLGPQPAENMKLALRSQRLATPSTSTIDIGRKKKQIVSPIRRKPEIMGRTSSSGMLPPSSDTPFVLAPHEPRKQTVHKLIETLNGEANQHLITNLNIKFDRMQKGWIQMDKEGQSATKYRNKADRQAAIWKSKRRARKPKSVEQHKYSPVQMLFMKNFNLTSICRWFLESTETKSLVIVKKVNTRLPSETQLCFHSSSGVSGTSQGVFPSIQAERLKKHLKKFAIASPVKNNPKSQKLIAKVLEQEAVKEKDKELTDANQALTKPSSVPVSVQISEGHKVSGKSKNPASARILRKYSNIREKRQVQQTNAGHKETTKTLKHSKLKKLTTSKSVSKSNPKSTLKTQKAAIPVDDQAKVLSPTASKGKPNTGRKPSEKPAVSERTVKSSGSNKASRELVRKASVSPQRCSQRLGSPKTLKKLIQSTKSKVHSNKNPLEMAKIEVENLAKASSTKSQTKESLQNKVSESDAVETTVGATQQNMDTKSPISSDQVLTRSQKKMEAMLPVNASPTTASKKALKSNTSGLSLSGSKKAGGEAVVTRSGTPKSSRKKGLVPSPSRSVTKKKPTKRAQEYLETPIKRTRMSQIK